MSKPLRAINVVLLRAIDEREAVCAALHTDYRSANRQRKLAEWSEGGPPEGETLTLLSQLRPQQGYGEFDLAFQRANAEALQSGLGAVLCPKLEDVRAAHMELLSDAYEAYTTSSKNLPSLAKHCQALDAIIQLVRAYEPTAAQPPSAKDGIEFSVDYRWCRWGTEEFTFTDKQALAVKILADAYHRGNGAPVPQLRIQAHVSPQNKSFDLRAFFRRQVNGKRLDHPAWNRMIVRVEPGQYRIVDPQ